MAFFRKAIEKLAKGLARTREKFVSGLRSLVSGRQIDDSLLDELEERMITADMGVATAAKIRADLQTAYKEKRIAKGEDVIDFLKEDLKKYWPEADRGIRFSAEPPTVILVAGVNGSGKTTSIAKLAYTFRAQGKKVC